MIDLNGRIAIVTGAGRGIGAGIASAMARVGATVAIVDIDGESAAAHAAAIESAGGIAAAPFVPVGGPSATAPVSSPDVTLKSTMFWNGGRTSMRPFALPRYPSSATRTS